MPVKSTRLTVPEPDRVLIRPATAADLAAVAEIQQACPEAAHWNAADYLAHEFLVAVAGDRITGFAVARRVATDETELLNLAVDPAFRRHGIGRRLLAALASGNKGALWLEVRESNAAARKLYKAFGFKEIGLRAGYYQDSGESAIVMKFHSW